MHHHGDDDNDRDEAGYANEFHDCGQFARLVGDDIARTNHLRDIMNGRTEKDAGRDVVVMKIRN